MCYEYQLRCVHGGECCDLWGWLVSVGVSVEMCYWEYIGFGYCTFGDAWLVELGE